MKHTRARSCTGKTRHPTRQAAMDHIYHLMRRDAAVGMHAYRCKFCKNFHIGHAPRRKSR